MKYLIALVGWLSCALPAIAQDRFPGSDWDQIDAAQAGWSTDRLKAAQNWSNDSGTSGVVIVQHGAIVASWGDVTANILLNSVRKSLLSALIGIAVERQ